MKTFRVLVALLCSITLVACSTSYKMISSPSPQQVQQAVVVGEQFYFTAEPSGAPYTKDYSVVVASKDAQSFKAKDGSAYLYTDVKIYYQQESSAAQFGQGVLAVLLFPFFFICIAVGACKMQ